MGKIFGYETTNGRAIDGDGTSGEGSIIGKSLRDPDGNKERYAVASAGVIENERMGKEAGNRKNSSWELLSLHSIFVISPEI